MTSNIVSFQQGVGFGVEVSAPMSINLTSLTVRV